MWQVPHLHVNIFLIYSLDPHSILIKYVIVIAATLTNVHTIKNYTVCRFLYYTHKKNTTPLTLQVMSVPFITTKTAHIIHFKKNQHNTKLENQNFNNIFISYGW